MSTSSYRMGVDLGTTFTAAAVARQGDYAMVNLGSSRVDVPSLVAMTTDGALRFGDEAERLADERPLGVAREFKRRLGDPVPLIIDGRPYSPQALMAHLLRWTVDTVAGQMGAPPELIAVTCPANWGPYKHELLRQVIRMAEVPSAIVFTEPEAAAIRHAGADAQREGALVGVYDLGGGTFDAVVLRPTANGVFAMAGSPEGIEHLGGTDMDQAMFAFVLRSLGPQAFDLASSDDPAVLSALATVRRRCVRAKEELSSDHLTEVAVELPGHSIPVRVTRPEFEAMIRPALADTIRAFQRAVRNAGTTPEALSSVVLVGGSTRIPLVFETISRTLDCQVVVPREPGHSVALGAAMAAERYRLPALTSRRPTRTRRPVARPAPPAPPPRREATVALRELLRLRVGEQAQVEAWQVPDGARVELGQPLVTLRLVGPARPRSVILQSPYQGVLHRHFVGPAESVALDDLLMAFRDVGAFLWRPGRALPDDRGVLLQIDPATSATAGSARPVVLVDRVPRAVWWSATFCLLTGPGRHTLSVAYNGRNQWYGFATQEVQVPEIGLAELGYREPGTGATAVLQPRPRAVELAVPR